MIARRYLWKPDWPSGWQLGEPDLIVSMSKEFELPASGPDVYRNFVIPIPTDRVRFVRGMEFRPGNDRVVHHAFMLIDATRRLRALDGEDGQPGFAGMDTKSAASPDGHFVGVATGTPTVRSSRWYALAALPEHRLGCAGPHAVHGKAGEIEVVGWAVLY